MYDVEIHRRRIRLRRFAFRDRRYSFWAHILFDKSGNYLLELLYILKVSV